MLLLRWSVSLDNRGMTDSPSKKLKLAMARSLCFIVVRDSRVMALGSAQIAIQVRTYEVELQFGTQAQPWDVHSKAPIDSIPIPTL
jgi:hypothetical protein